MRRGCELIALALLGGCWGKAAIDLSGTYHVDSHIASACTTDVPVADPAAYLRLVSSAHGYELQDCSGIDAMTCGGWFELTDPIDDDGWKRRQDLFVVISESAECGLTREDATAVLDEDTWLTVDATTYSATFSTASRQCTAATSADYDELPCVSHQQLSATRLTNAKR